MKKKSFIISVLILFFYPVLVFSATADSNSRKITGENLCGAKEGYYSTYISDCFGKRVALIGVLSSEDRVGSNVYFLKKPVWGDRNRLSFPSKNNHFETSPDEYGPDVPKIFVEFKKTSDIREFSDRLVKVIGKVDSKESNLLNYFGAYGDPGDKPKMIIVEVEQIERYVPPETWTWMADDIPFECESNEIITKNVTQTAKFFPADVNSESDCLFLDSSTASLAKDQFKKIVLEGIENGSMKEYEISGIEMTARGSLEKRVYNLGECNCPPRAHCAPCGRHTAVCINPEEIWIEKSEGIKYGEHWFSGYINNPDAGKTSPDVSASLRNYLQYYNLPYVKVKDGNGNVVKTYEKLMFLNPGYAKIGYYPTYGVDYVLILKNESSYFTREDIFNHPVKLKVSGEKINAEYCIRPLKGQEDCRSCSLILMEKVFDEKGDNVIATR